jgi:hypothetical protein
MIKNYVVFGGSTLVGRLIWEIEDLCSWERKFDIWAFAVKERLCTYITASQERLLHGVS